MSKRLQVLLDESELSEIQQLAKARHMTVAAWVRQALREARQQQPVGNVERKLKVVREAARLSGPTADVKTMLSEIEQGYLGGQWPK